MKTMIEHWVANTEILKTAGLLFLSVLDFDVRVTYHYQKQLLLLSALRQYYTNAFSPIPVTDVAKFNFVESQNCKLNYTGLWNAPDDTNLTVIYKSN